MVDYVNVRNLETGAVGKIKRALFNHSYFNPGILVEVDDDAKSYAPELYKSKLAIESATEPTGDEPTDPEGN